jgi:hypothetical protein
MTEESPSKLEKSKNVLGTFATALGEALPGFLFASLIIVGLLILLAVIASNWQEISPVLKELFSKENRNETVIYAVSWLVLLVISFAAVIQIKEILESRRANLHRRRANQIAIMIGLVAVVLLFKQPYLNELFQGQDAGKITKGLLLGGGLASGWLIWYLKQVKAYGEFFHLFLLTVIVGFCWYARLTGPEEVQLTAVAFLLGSLFRIAKDYLDLANSEEKTSK